MKGNSTKGYSGGYVLSGVSKFTDKLAEKMIIMMFSSKEWRFI